MKRPDYNYHQNKLELLIRDLRDHTADELARVLMRLAIVSDSEVIKEKEFTSEMQQRIQELEDCLSDLVDKGKIFFDDNYKEPKRLLNKESK